MSTMIEKTGWVHEICVEVSDVEQTPYLSVTISSANREPRQPDEATKFLLIRNLSIDVVDNLGISMTANSGIPAISYSNASMAAISILKDAFWNRQRVTVRGEQQPGIRPDLPEPLLRSVCVRPEYIREESLGDQPGMATDQVRPGDKTIGTQPKGPFDEIDP